uniref:Uncharacterized protein n=1 Tax=Mycoplasmopsis agalactiae TaxID=2110 RepID=Q8KML0_MYCAA|nr:hypothetical protein [Mycoplasmopsis agalactiae PG2]
MSISTLVFASLNFALTCDEVSFIFLASSVNTPPSDVFASHFSIFFMLLSILLSKIDRFFNVSSSSFFASAILWFSSVGLTTKRGISNITVPVINLEVGFASITNFPSLSAVANLSTVNWKSSNFKFGSSKSVFKASNKSEPKTKLVKNLKLSLLTLDKSFLATTSSDFLIVNVTFMLPEYFLLSFLALTVAPFFKMLDTSNSEVSTVAFVFTKDSNIELASGISLSLGNTISPRFVFLTTSPNACFSTLSPLSCGFFCEFSFLSSHLAANKGTAVNDDAVNKPNNIFLFVFIIIYILFLKNNSYLYYIKVALY